ncbi:hypothetical protein ACIGEO_12655 [Stenotrophomonas bentonitica]|jgi:hypothetical protein|uniref:hypothetical protein n=1 Tax=Stenotrophomonas bentonitica TaxID=1450134 RepID=UPI000EC25509|nr:hypothetical protein [Stenotrophomonas sp.]
MSKKIDKKVLLSPVLAAMLGIAGTAGAAESQLPSDANTLVVTSSQIASPSLELNIDYLDIQGQLELDDAMAGTECTLYSSGGTKCTFYSSDSMEKLIAGEYGDGIFDV